VATSTQAAPEVGRSDGAASLVLPLEYAHELYADVLAWYHSAESKAQVILTLDGIFLAAITGLTLTKRVDFEAVLDTFTLDTWLLLAVTTAALLASIVSAVICLGSRTYTSWGLRRFYRDLGVDPTDESTYVPEVLWFFQHIEGLDREQFKHALRRLDADGELRVYGSQIHILSGNVRHKHAWVNRAFAFAGLTLVMLIALMTDYALRVAVD
jgi:hypothetical protein